MEIDAQLDPQRLSVAFSIQSECFLLQSITRSLAWCPKFVIFTLELAHSTLTVLHYCWNHESGLWTAAPVSSAVTSLKSAEDRAVSSDVLHQSGFFFAVYVVVFVPSLTNVHVL